jgi:hypothetical protein
MRQKRMMTGGPEGTVENWFQRTKALEWSLGVAGRGDTPEMGWGLSRVSGALYGECQTWNMETSGHVEEEGVGVAAW